MSDKSKIQVTYWLILSLVLYVLSMFLPGLEFSEHAPVRGLDILSIGWLGVLGLDLGWYANPAYFIALLLSKKKPKTALWWSIASVLLGATAFFSSEWWFNEGSGTPIERLGVGFYFWLAGLLILAMVLRYRASKSLKEINS